MDATKDPPDLRPIGELRFGSEWKPSLGELQAAQPGFGAEDAPVGRRKGDWAEEEVVAKWKATHATDLAAMTDGLKKCGCTVAEDIKKLGCTGVVAKTQEGVEGDITAVGIALGKFMRMGLGGTGVGLPCFVPPTRYCLVHETIGGLQAQQEVFFAKVVETISRPLTALEAGRTQLTEAARRAYRRGDVAETLDVLGGYKLPGEFEIAGPRPPAPHDALDDTFAGAGEPDDITPEEEKAFQRAVRGDRPWTCSEHDTTNWACRYCVAQAIVEGPLEPQYVVDTIGDGTNTAIKPDEMEALLAKHDASAVPHVEVSVLVMSLKRKLSRE